MCEDKKMGMCIARDQNNEPILIKLGKFESETWVSVEYRVKSSLSSAYVLAPPP